MKKCAIACSAIFFLSFHASAQTYLNCDFSQGIPADFTLIDNDGNTPSATMQKEGFKVGTPWLAATPKGESNTAACSTSWYAAKGTSDDWMITPSFAVTDEHSELSWRAKVSDKRNRDGYAVYISTTGGNTIGNFDKSQPLFTTDAEEPEWTHHTVSLDAYRGKTVSIAFVNNSTDKSRLYIDDIAAGVHSNVLCRLTTGKGVPSLGDAEISGIAYTNEDTATDGFDVTLTYGGDSYTQHFDDRLEKGKEMAFTLDKKIKLEKYSPVSYGVTVSSAGQSFTASSTVTAYQRKVVCEEGTGTWCGYCVRGLVYVDSLKEHAADWAVPIAAHSGDPMQSEYVSEVSKYFGSDGYPTGCVNRIVRSDPKDFFVYGKALFKKESVLVDIDLQAQLDTESRTVESAATLHFAEAGKNTQYALAYAIIENNVHQPGDSKYSQHNSYANGENGPMGGYEKYGEYIPSEVMYYQCVARGYVDDINGIEGSVPADFAADEPLTDKRAFALPDNILDDRNTVLVAMLIDRSDNHIVNAQTVPLGSNEQTGISTVRTQTSGSRTAEYYTADGIRTNGLRPGLNIVRLGNGRTVKIIRR